MGEEFRIGTRLGGEEVTRLHAGDVVYLTGELFTMRDQAHLRALEILRGGGRLPFDLAGGTVYHCGPLVKGNKVISAGPTTSMRMERSEGELIERTKLRCILGKGGMGTSTLGALKRHGAVYMEYPGGAGALAARSITGIRGVFWRELGDPEAVWVLDVKDLGPCFVTMDSYGNVLRRKP
ncbi:MAG: FumA C-terminus/TtdB family hydratase beta subunit [Candidatus Verstraetearchaeota archaeon]|nr:FumA C-terminus/TtdB family hydratase beta subunit [Candidatus Verstraetearchaeota archaeon]